MLKLPGDGFVTIELVNDPHHDIDSTNGLSHFVAQVQSMSAALAQLAGHGVEAERPTSPEGSEDFLTSSVVDGVDGGQRRRARCADTRDLATHGSITV